MNEIVLAVIAVFSGGVSGVSASSIISIYKAKTEKNMLKAQEKIVHEDAEYRAAEVDKLRTELLSEALRISSEQTRQANERAHAMEESFIAQIGELKGQVHTLTLRVEGLTRQLIELGHEPIM